MTDNIEQDAHEADRLKQSAHRRKGLPLPSHIETAPPAQPSVEVAPAESAQPIELIQPAKMPPITGMFGPDVTSGNVHVFTPKTEVVDPRIAELRTRRADLERQLDAATLLSAPDRIETVIRQIAVIDIQLDKLPALLEAEKEKAQDAEGYRKFIQWQIDATQNRLERREAADARQPLLDQLDKLDRAIYPLDETWRAMHENRRHGAIASQLERRYGMAEIAALLPDFDGTVDELRAHLAALEGKRK